MKHLSKWLLAGALALCGSPAMADDTEQATVTFNVADPSALSATISVPVPGGEWWQKETTPLTLEAGDNVLTYPIESEISISAVAPYIMAPAIYTSYNEETGEYNSTEQGLYDGRLEVTFAAWNDGQKYTVRCFNPETDRTAQCTVKVDDPSQVKLAYAAGQEIALQAGDNIVKFAPGYETSLTADKASYWGNNWYQVTFNGTPLEANWGSYTIPLVDGAVVDIQVNFPDLPSVVTFDLPEGCQDIISGISFDNVDVTDFDGHTATGKLGQTMAVGLNTNVYRINNVYIDGESIYYYGSAFTRVLNAETMTVKIEGEKLATFDATVKVSNPREIAIYAGYADESNRVEFGEDNQAVVTLNEIDNFISFRVDATAKLVSVTINGEPYDPGTYTTITLEDRDVVEFVTEPYVIDQTAAFWIDDFSAMPYCNLTTALRKNMPEGTLKTGYSLVEFAPEFAPFNLSWYNQDQYECAVYLDGTLVEPAYAGGTSFYLDLTDGSVVKVFTSTQPVTSTVAFTLPAGCTVTRDVIVPLTADEVSAGISVFNGTKINVAGIPAGKTLLVNGAEAETDASGNASFIVGENSEVTVGSAPAKLTVEFTGTGATTASVAEGSTASVAVTTDGFWIVESILFNGESVADQVENGVYTTPGLLGNNTLKVTVAYDGELNVVTTATGEVTVGSVDFAVKDGAIVISGLESGDQVVVYSIAGHTVTTQTAAEPVMSISLSGGTYVVRVNNNAAKVIL